MAMGQKSVPPVNVSIPTKVIRLKWVVNSPTNQNDIPLVLTTMAICLVCELQWTPGLDRLGPPGVPESVPQPHHAHGPRLKIESAFNPELPKGGSKKKATRELPEEKNEKYRCLQLDAATPPIWGWSSG